MEEAPHFWEEVVEEVELHVKEAEVVEVDLHEKEVGVVQVDLHVKEAGVVQVDLHAREEEEVVGELQGQGVVEEEVAHLAWKVEEEGEGEKGLQIQQALMQQLYS